MAEIKIYKSGSWRNIIGQEFSGNVVREGDKVFAGGEWHEAENLYNFDTPLTFIAREANSTIKLIKKGNPTVSGLQYRYGTSGDWKNYTIDTVLKLTNIGDKVQFKNTENNLSTFWEFNLGVDDSSSYVTFEMTGKIAGMGNIQSMLNWREDCPAYCYFSLFYQCTSLVTAPELPATVLADYCYFGMFFGCTGLTTAPELPATVLADYCYAVMFADCSSLINAPELPAENLVKHCYNEMFYNCNRLCSIKVHFTSWGGDATNTWTYKWLLGVSLSGTFYKPSALPLEYGEGNIPEGWAVVNID